MKIDDIEVIDAAILKTPEGKSPIFCMDVDFNILSKRGKKTYRTPYTAKTIVGKGTIQEMRKDRRFKRALLREAVYAGESNFKKKVLDFDLSNIEIKETRILHFKGYGKKE